VDPKVLEELFRENSGMGLRILGNLANRLKKAYEIIEKFGEEKPLAEVIQS
jgi:hypothetical protein